MAFRYTMMAPGVDNIVREDVTVPPPDAGEVQIRLRASSLNFHDYVTLTGLVPWIEYPKVPLSDGCGEIVAVGEDVARYAVGDRVITLFYPLWHGGPPTAGRKRRILGESVDGCLQELINIDARSVARAPANLNDAEAATLVCAGHTAWYALMEEATLSGKETVLVQGTGGVSLFALQFALAAGARVVATSSSDHKLEKLRELGACQTVNYVTVPEWQERVRELAGGFDVAIDVGGETTLGRAVACANTGAFIGVVGVLGGFGAAAVSIIDIMQKNLTIQGITVGCGESLERMCRFVEKHDIRPQISHTLGTGELSEGLRIMESGRHFGKIAISLA